MDAKEFLKEQPKVYRLSWVERLLEEYDKQKREEKELQVLNILSNQFRMHGWSDELKKLHTSIVLAIKNATDK